MQISSFLISVILYSFYVMRVESAECTSEQIIATQTLVQTQVHGKAEICLADLSGGSGELSKEALYDSHSICQHKSCEDFMEALFSLEYPDCTIGGQNIADQSHLVYQNLTSNYHKLCDESNENETATLTDTIVIGESVEAHDADGSNNADEAGASSIKQHNLFLSVFVAISFLLS